MDAGGGGVQFAGPLLGKMICPENQKVYLSKTFGGCIVRRDKPSSTTSDF